MHAFLIHLLLTAGLGLLPNSIQGDSPIRNVLQKVLDHQAEIDKQLERFGYTETLRREEDGKQKLLETYEVSFYKGRRVRRLTSRNGKALEGSSLARENERVEKEIRKLEKGDIPPLSNRRVKLEDLLHCSVFTDVQDLTVDGRKVVFAQFHPNPQVKPRNVNERFVHNLDGKLWVDATALQMVSFEFVLRDAFNIGGGLWFSMKPGTHFIDQEEWSFSKIWLPKLHEFDMNAKAMMGVKLLIKDATTYSSFREFDVNTQDLIAAPRH